MFRPIIAVFTFLLVLSVGVLADEERHFDVSRAWFKPELLINSEPGLCDPIFKSYLDYFVTPEAINPLIPISARTSDEPSLATTIQELKWSSFGEHGTSNGVISDMRLAEWHDAGKYFGIVERSESIGWRPPTSGYYLLDKPPSEGNAANIADDHSGIGAIPISFLGKTDKPDLFDLIDYHSGDPRVNNPDQHMEVQVANVYSFNKHTYLALTAGNPRDPGPSVFLVTHIESPKKLKLVCKFSTSPSSVAIEKESGKVAHYKEFEDVIWNIMGGSGNCGTLNSHAGAENNLREELDMLFSRPWRSFSSDHEDFDASSFFKGWGYNGAWNYRKYLELKAVLPKVTRALAGKYEHDYQMNQKDARKLANDGISVALEQGFIDADTAVNGELIRALLEGRSEDEVSTLLPDPYAIKRAQVNGGDSLLAFAIGHPRLVELLLKRGFNPNDTNDFGKTPLMYAAQFNDLKSAKLLVRYGANTELATTQPSDTCNYTINLIHVTALHYAVRYASYDFIKWLVRIGAVTSAKDSQGNTPLDYLTKTSGFVGYLPLPEKSYGQQNVLLTKAQFDSLRVTLAPLTEEKRQRGSADENRKAESLYQSGKLQEAYLAVKRSLSFNPNNERAMSNLSLIALKLGYLGESAKTATYIAKNSHSEEERASAYFNLGLACQAAGKEFHYAAFNYDGATYCQEQWDQYQGPLYYYLKAYQTAPTGSRANTIVDFFDKSDSEHGKWLCKAGPSASGPRAVYLAGHYIYFLGNTGIDISYQRFAQRIKARTGTNWTYRGSDTDLVIQKKEEIRLENGLSIFRWQTAESLYQYPFPLVLENQLCTKLFPSFINDGTELVRLFANSYAYQYKIFTISSNTSKPIALLLTGNTAKWVISADSKNIAAIIVSGNGTPIQFLGKNKPPTYIDPHPPRVDYVNSTDGMIGFAAMIGLKIGATINVEAVPSDRPGIDRPVWVVPTKNVATTPPLDLTDAMLTSLPVCEGYNFTRCRLP